MKWLEKNIETINELVKIGSPASLTYAALECRLAIEMFCYAKLRNEHNYIAHEDLKKWQAPQVVNQLMDEVNPKISDNLEFSISLEKSKIQQNEITKEDIEAQEFLSLGEQVAFDVNKIKNLWNAMGSFLHARIPKTESDDIIRYNNEKIHRKIKEVLTELSRLSKGDLFLSGFGEEVNFKCKCGKLNRRKSEYLNNNQLVNCFNPKCKETWLVEKNNDEINFQRNTLAFYCSECKKEHLFPAKILTEMPTQNFITFYCECGEENYIQWRLKQIKKRN